MDVCVYVCVCVCMCVCVLGMGDASRETLTRVLTREPGSSCMLVTGAAMLRVEVVEVVERMIIDGNGDDATLHW